MKKMLFLLFTSLTIFQVRAQAVVDLADFSRRPQFYQGKTIVLRNVEIYVTPNDESQPAQHRIQPKNNRLKGEKTFSLITPPRCMVRKGWTLLYPTIPDIKTPLCFAVMTRMYNRLPQQGTYRADITVQVDVRAISEIKKVRVLR